MRYTVIVEDTPRGVCIGYAESRNGCQDHPASSLATHVVTSFALTVDNLVRRNLLVVDQQKLLTGPRRERV